MVAGRRFLGAVYEFGDFKFYLVFVFAGGLRGGVVGAREN